MRCYAISKRFYAVFNPLKSGTVPNHITKVFGELGSREAARTEAAKQAIDIVGVHVPGRPEEPTNCCMSGCVNCVWVLFKDEYLEYKRAKREAIRRLNLPENRHIPWPPQLLDNSKEQEKVDTGLDAFVDAERKIYERREKKLKEKK